MEYGLIPNIDQFKDNNSIAVQQIQSTNKTSQLDEQNKLQELEREEFLKVDTSNKVEKTASEATAQYHEVVLTNMNFGFNDSSKDFFVKAVRGEVENQYPTEQMMRLKAYFMNLDTAS